MGGPAIAPRTNVLLVACALVVAAVLGAGVLSGSGPAPVVGGPLIALAITLALTPAAMWLSYRLRVLDVPDERKTHGEPMPLLGGWAVLVGAVAGGAVALLALPARTVSPSLVEQLAATCAGGLLIAAMGTADDARGLKPVVRLIGQMAAVCLVMRYGVEMTFLPPTALGRVGEIALTVLWIVGITNALNFLDGLDGLASGVSAVAAVSFGAIALMTGQTAVAVAAFCVAGAALGFLWYNFRPASIYLGDAGATLLGFWLACIGIIGDWGAPDRAVDLFVPVIVLGLPIYDTIYITLYRFRKGLVRSLAEWVEYVGRDHLHHRLQALGMRPSRTCLFICLGGVALGLLAAILQTKKEGMDRYDKYLALAVAVIMFVGATILMQLGSRRNSGQ